MGLLKQIIICVAVAFTCHAHAYQTDSDDGHGPDKLKHFVASGAVSSALYLGLRSAEYSRFEALGGAMACTITLGLLKELTDDKFSTKDMQANVVGAMVPVFLIRF